jgi:hypothetical protein
MTEFDDLTKRILDKLDGFEEKIESLCERLMKVEYELNNHFKEIENKQSNKDRKFYIIIAGMGITFTLVEINNLQVHLKPKHCHFNISMDNNSNVEITFDGGSNWADFSTGKKLEVADEYHLVLKPSDSFNLRATGGSGTTVEHCAIYAEV